MFGLAMLALFLGAGLYGQLEPPAPADIQLDVVVTDARGQRASTLTAADFSLVSGGQPLKVVAARFVGGTQGAELSVPSSPARLFAILLDDYHVTAGASAERVRAALTTFVRDDLRDGDGVVVLRPLDSLLSISLTTDRQRALEAIAAFSPRRDDYTPRSDFERNFIAEAPIRVEATRARIVTSAMHALIAQLAQAPGVRRTLLVVSEGFVDNGVRRGEDIAPPLRTAITAANRANVTIYTVNPAALPDPAVDGAARAAAEHTALQALAADTGGLSTDAPADLHAALAAVYADATGYYVVSFAAPRDDAEGVLEPVTVRVARRDVSVRTQKAFAGPMAIRPAAPQPASFLSAFSAQLPRRTSQLIRPWFGMARGSDGNTRVSFVWEPAARVPGDRTAVGAPAKIALTVTTLDGQPVYRGAVTPAASLLATPAAEGARASFDVPPGRLLVQMAIEDLSSKVIDRDVRDIIVGGFPGPVSLGSAEVFRTRTARERQWLDANADAIPIAARQFSRNERLTVRVPVITSGVPEMSARLISAFGNVMRELPVTPVPTRANVFQVDLPLAPFASGAYVIEMIARTPEGSASERLPIRVTP